MSRGRKGRGKGGGSQPRDHPPAPATDTMDGVEAGSMDEKRCRSDDDVSTSDEDGPRRQPPKRCRADGDAGEVSSPSPSPLPEGGADVEDEGGSGGVSDGTGLQLLYFPKGLDMSPSQRMEWAAKLARVHYDSGGARIRLKTSGTGQHLQVRDGDATLIDTLTTVGFDNVIMERRREAPDRCVKVLVGPYPVDLDLDYLKVDSRVKSVRRHKVRGQPRPAAVVEVLGDEVPDKLEVLGNGYRYCRKYFEEPIFCLKCSRYGHMAYLCPSGPRCRYCGRGHHSTVCAEKIKRNEKVTPRCCHCLGPHNANSTLCVRWMELMGHKIADDRRVSSLPRQDVVPAPVPHITAWGRHPRVPWGGAAQWGPATGLAARPPPPPPHILDDEQFPSLPGVGSKPPGHGFPSPSPTAETAHQDGGRGVGDGDSTRVADMLCEMEARLESRFSDLVDRLDKMDAKVEERSHQATCGADETVTVSGSGVMDSPEVAKSVVQLDSAMSSLVTQIFEMAEGFFADHHKELMRRIARLEGKRGDGDYPTPHEKIVGKEGVREVVHGLAEGFMGTEPYASLLATFREALGGLYPHASFT